MKYNRSVKIKSAALLIVFISIMGWIYECAFYSLTEGEFIRHAEPLYFDSIPLMTRNYK